MAASFLTATTFFWTTLVSGPAGGGSGREPGRLAGESDPPSSIRSHHNECYGDFSTTEPLDSRLLCAKCCILTACTLDRKMAAAQIGVAMNALRVALCSVLVLIAIAPLMAQGTYTQIDVPGAFTTFCYGINTAGDIVGTYVDSPGNFIHGFLLSNGTYTTIDYP